MSDPVLSQLVSVESDLAQQVDSLESQLTQIQARREGLRTVIDMFEGGDSSEPSTSASAAKTAARKPGRPSGSKTSRKTTKKTADKTTARKKPGRKPKSSTSTSAKAKATKTAGKKKDGRAADWQKYVQSEFKESALPEAVSSVLRSAPSEVFKIADVMSSIFIEDVPRDQFLKARNRISNILSAGARDGSWYRGRNGRYSQSENATK